MAIFGCTMDVRCRGGAQDWVCTVSHLHRNYPPSEPCGFSSLTTLAGVLGEGLPRRLAGSAWPGIQSACSSRGSAVCDSSPEGAGCRPFSPQKVCSSRFPHPYSAP